MTIDKNKTYKEQTEEVKSWLNTFIDLSQVAECDNFNRPSVYRFSVSDSTGATYVLELTNVYQSERSWALKSQNINLIPV